MIVELWKGGNFLMWKKGLPFVFMSVLLLGACGMNNDEALPRNDETPMQDIDDRERKWTPDAGDERRGGADLDGIETDERSNDEIMNDDDPFDNDEAPLDNEKGDRDLNNR